MQPNKSKNLKGQVDLIYLLVWFFAAALVLVVTVTIWSNLTSNPSFQALTQATATGNTAVASTTTSLNIFANSLVFIFIFACIASIIASSFANSSPAFAVIGIIAMPVEIIFAFFFHDAFLTIVSQSAFAGIVNQYPALIYGFQYLPVISLIVSVIMIVVVFLKP